MMPILPAFFITRLVGIIAFNNLFYRDKSLFAPNLKFGLYDVDYLARHGDPGELSHDNYILHMRRRHSVPVLEAFKKWLVEKEPLVLPSSKLGQAISYALNGRSTTTFMRT